jgi:hypothetical protein
MHDGRVQEACSNPFICTRHEQVKHNLTYDNSAHGLHQVYRRTLHLWCRTSRGAQLWLALAL